MVKPVRRGGRFGSRAADCERRDTGGRDQGRARESSRELARPRFRTVQASQFSMLGATLALAVVVSDGCAWHRRRGHRPRGGPLSWPAFSADGHSTDRLPAARTVSGRAGISRRPDGGRPGRAGRRDSECRSGGVAGHDVYVVTAARRLLVGVARALTSDRRSGRRVCRDLPAVVHDSACTGS